MSKCAISPSLPPSQNLFSPQQLSKCHKFKLLALKISLRTWLLQKFFQYITHFNSFFFAGKSLDPIIFKVFGITLGVIVSIAVLVGVIYYIRKQIKYAFFPSCHPPLIIEVCIYGFYYFAICSSKIIGQVF